MNDETTRLVERLRRDRAIFAAALREIATEGPATEPEHPGRIDMTTTAAERYGIQQGLWTQAERARRALAEGGAS